MTKLTTRNLTAPARQVIHHPLHIALEYKLKAGDWMKLQRIHSVAGDWNSISWIHVVMNL